MENLSFGLGLGLNLKNSGIEIVIHFILNLKKLPFINLFLRSICQFKCNDGYELFGNNIMECTASKKWNPDEVPECREIRCNKLPALPHGNVKCSDENRHQSVCRFVCGEGYRIKGSRSSVCSSDGSWSAPMPVCVEIVCDELTPPLNGSKKCSGAKFGEKCQFSCNTGYDLSGSEIRTCQADGTWTGVPIHCTQVRIEFDWKKYNKWLYPGISFSILFIRLLVDSYRNHVMDRCHARTEEPLGLFANSAVISDTLSLVQKREHVKLITLGPGPSLTVYR